MALSVVPYGPEHEASVAKFNARMRAGAASTEFLLPERSVPMRPDDAVRWTQHIACDDAGEVRGGVMIVEGPGWIGGRLQTVINIQELLSEGIVDRRFMLVAHQLIAATLKLAPFVYAVGMGGKSNPLPRMLQGLGWQVRAIPFYFRMLRVGRCLAEVAAFRSTRARELAASALRFTGLGWLGARWLQRFGGSRRILAVDEMHSWTADVDPIWNAVRQRCSFAVVRDSSTLPLLNGDGVRGFRARDGDTLCGWFSLAVAQMRENQYFGNLRVAVVADLVALPGYEAPLLASASDQASRLGCDLVCTNLLPASLQDAARRSGWLAGPSNFLLATSKPMTAAMDDRTAYVSRRDGDGLATILPSSGSGAAATPRTSDGPILRTAAGATHSRYD
jgi:hypothetical protein